MLKDCVKKMLKKCLNAIKLLHLYAAIFDECSNCVKKMLKKGFRSSKHTSPYHVTLLYHILESHMTTKWEK
jgi:hypothetical protein